MFLSGTTGMDPGTGRMAGDSMQAQTRQALANCEAILREAGATLDDVVEVGVLLTDPGDFAGMNEEYARWFPSDPPTRYAAKLGAESASSLSSPDTAAGRSWCPARITRRIEHETARISGLAVPWHVCGTDTRITPVSAGHSRTTQKGPRQRFRWSGPLLSVVPPTGFEPALPP